MAERNSRLVARKLTEGCLTLSLLATVAGCGATRPAAAPRHEHWVPAYVFGIWGKSELDVRDDCPDAGASRIRIGATWSTFLVSVVTLGIYTPREVIVRCRAHP
jgi:Bor protein